MDLPVRDASEKGAPSSTVRLVDESLVPVAHPPLTAGHWRAPGNPTKAVLPGFDPPRAASGGFPPSGIRGVRSRG